MEEIMSSPAERKAFAREVAAAVWEYELASRNEDENEGTPYPAGGHLAMNNGNLWELIRRSAPESPGK